MQHENASVTKVTRRTFNLNANGEDTALKMCVLVTKYDMIKGVYSLTLTYLNQQRTQASKKCYYMCHSWLVIRAPFSCLFHPLFITSLASNKHLICQENKRVTFPGLRLCEVLALTCEYSIIMIKSQYYCRACLSVTVSPSAPPVRSHPSPL